MNSRFQNKRRKLLTTFTHHHPRHHMSSTQLKKHPSFQIYSSCLRVTRRTRLSRGCPELSREFTLDASSFSSKIFITKQILKSCDIPQTRSDLSTCTPPSYNMPNNIININLWNSIKPIYRRRSKFQSRIFFPQQIKLHLRYSIREFLSLQLILISITPGLGH